MADKDDTGTDKGPNSPSPTPDITTPSPLPLFPGLSLMRPYLSRDRGVPKDDTKNLLNNSSSSSTLDRPSQDPLDSLSPDHSQAEQVEHPTPTQTSQSLSSPSISLLDLLSLTTVNTVNPDPMDQRVDTPSPSSTTPSPLKGNSPTSRMPVCLLLVLAISTMITCATASSIQLPVPPTNLLTNNGPDQLQEPEDAPSINVDQNPLAPLLLQMLSPSSDQALIFLLTAFLLVVIYILYTATRSFPHTRRTAINCIQCFGTLCLMLTAFVKPNLASFCQLCVALFLMFCASFQWFGHRNFFNTAPSPEDGTVTPIYIRTFIPYSCTAWFVCFQILYMWFLLVLTPHSVPPEQQIILMFAPLMFAAYWAFVKWTKFLEPYRTLMLFAQYTLRVCALTMMLIFMPFISFPLFHYTVVSLTLVLLFVILYQLKPNTRPGSQQYVALKIQIIVVIMFCLLQSTNAAKPKETYVGTDGTDFFQKQYPPLDLNKPFVVANSSYCLGDMCFGPVVHRSRGKWLPYVGPAYVTSDYKVGYDSKMNLYYSDVSPSPTCDQVKNNPKPFIYGPTVNCNNMRWQTIRSTSDATTSYAHSRCPIFVPIVPSGNFDSPTQPCNPASLTVGEDNLGWYLTFRPVPGWPINTDTIFNYPKGQSYYQTTFLPFDFAKCGPTFPAIAHFLKNAFTNCIPQTDSQIGPYTKDGVQVSSYAFECTQPNSLQCHTRGCLSTGPDWNQQPNDLTNHVCVPPFLYQGYQVTAPSPDFVHLHDGFYYAPGTYPLPGAVYYPGLTRTKEKPEGVDVQYPILVWHSDCTHPQYKDGRLCFYSTKDYPTDFGPTCAAFVTYTTVTVVCDAVTPLEFCCGQQCTNYAPTKVHLIPLPLTNVGQYCSYTGNGDDTRSVFVVPHSLVESHQLLGLFFNAPWYVIFSIFVSFVWLLHFVLIKLKVLNLILFCLMYLVKLVFYCCKPKPKSVSLSGVCPKCKKNVSPGDQDNHNFVFHGTVLQLLNPFNLWRRYKIKTLALDGSGYYKTPLGPFSGHSWLAWLLILLCFGKVKHVQGVVIQYDGSTYTGRGLTIAVSQTTVEYSCTEDGYYYTHPDYFCDSAFKCSTPDSCPSLPNRDCLPNYQWKVTDAFFWGNGCFEKNKGSACVRCFRKPGKSSKKATRFACTQSTMKTAAIVTCHNGSSHLYLTSSGQQVTNCGPVNFQMVLTPAYQQTEFTYYANNLWRVNNQCPVHKGNCPTKPMICNTAVVGTSMSTTCNPFDCYPDDPSPLNSCGPIFSPNNVLTLQSCVTQQISFEFEPYEEKDPVGNSTFLLQKCNSVESGHCTCTAVMVCDKLAKFHNHIVVCGNPFYINAPCTTVACVTNNDVETCIPVTPGDPRPPQFQPVYTANDYGSGFWNWLPSFDLFSIKNVFIIVVVSFLFLLFLNIFMKFCPRSSKKDK